MTSKERAKLKSIASNTDTILQIGKNPIGDTFLKQVGDALAARELIKIHVLETCELSPAEAAKALSEALGCETVQVIGSKVVLFSRRKKGDKRGSYLDKDGGAGKAAAADKEKKSAGARPVRTGGNGKGSAFDRKKSFGGYGQSGAAKRSAAAGRTGNKKGKTK